MTFPPRLWSDPFHRVRERQEGASSVGSGAFGEAGRAFSRLANARREMPLRWPPIDAMPLTGDLLARDVSEPREDRIAVNAEGIFIRPVPIAVKGFGCRAVRGPAAARRVGLRIEAP